MIVKHYHYDRLNPYIDLFIDRMNEFKFRYYASELLKQVLHSFEFNLDFSIRKAIAICKLTGIPVQEHFSCIYRSDGTGLIKDWRLSDLACSLVLVSFNASNPELDEIQQGFMDYLGI